ncbi:MAG: DDE domain-containing protein [Chloroflexi bacterium]|nr:MAG: DDE domain-containing protein [Chloroflexota bacterium]
MSSLHPLKDWSLQHSRGDSVAGRWCYLYRAIDRDGQLLDSMLSEHRDRSAARRFLRGLLEVIGAASVACDDRSPRGVSEGHSLDLRSEGDLSPRSVFEQPDRTVASAVETAVLPDAGLR